MKRMLQVASMVFCMSVATACGGGDLESKYNKFTPGGDSPEGVYMTLLNAARQNDKESFLEVARNMDMMMSIILDAYTEKYEEAVESGDAKRIEKTKGDLDKFKLQVNTDGVLSKETEKFNGILNKQFEEIKELVQQHLGDAEVNPDDLASEKNRLGYSKMRWEKEIDGKTIYCEFTIFQFKENGKWYYLQHSIGAN